MYCRKCGNEIPDDSIFCLKCGTKVEVKEEKEIQPEETTEDVQDNITSDMTEQTTDEQNKSVDNTITDNSNGINKKAIWIIVGIVAVLFIIVMASESAKKCNYSGCDNNKKSGSEYCYEHSCGEDGCTLSKSKYSSYCYKHELEHQCTVDGCENSKYGDSEYCSNEHKCAQSGCNNRNGWTSDYCDEHTVDMRTRLDMISFNFSLNSAGGIELDFRAKNKSGKEIKYVRFDITMKNAVGDSLTDDISGDATIPVEIIGPVKAGKEVYMNDELIGYCDNCARIDVYDVTIVYTDGTSETGHLGYYAD